MKKALVIGIGDPFQGDDAAGIDIVRRLEQQMAPLVDVAYSIGNTTHLMDLWEGREKVFLIDVVSTGMEETGYLHVFSENIQEIPVVFYQASTHLFDVVHAIEHAKALNKLPATLVLYGIEAQDFRMEAEISTGLMQKLPSITERIVQDICKRCNFEKSR